MITKTTLKIQKILFLCIFLNSIGGFAQNPIQQTYFISTLGSDSNTGTESSPFATLEKARNEIRTINSNMIGDIIVNIKEGVYELPNTLNLTLQDKGSNGFNIIYQAYRCDKPIISGGSKVIGWSLWDITKNIYKTNVSSNADSRQLYVNGTRATRARTTNGNGWTVTATGYDVPANVSNWGNVLDVEVVTKWHWKSQRGKIGSINGTLVDMVQPFWLRSEHHEIPEWIENAYELLDQEGEWYLDKSNDVIYYKPRIGENMATAEVVLPRLETLVSGSNLNNVQFKSLTFSYATWLFPNTADGLAIKQADIMAYPGAMFNQNQKEIKGNLFFDHCNNIKFEDNTFEHLGSTALQFYTFCDSNIILKNIFQDVSGSGIALGSNINETNADLVNREKDNIISNNLIQNVAAEYFGCVGIFACFTQNTKIIHNEIKNLPYSAISSGWGWNPNIIAGSDNEIAYNLVENVMQKLYDGAGIYTLGSHPNAQLHNNYIKNAGGSPGGLYPDEGSKSMRWHHNVVSNVDYWLSIWTGSIQNVTVDSNYFDSPNQRTNGTNCTVQNNMLVTNGNWPPQAVSIIANAGRQLLINRICVNPVSATISTNNSLQLSYNIQPINAINQNVIWSSSNNTIATVNGTGFVTGVSFGIAVIKVTTQDGGKIDSATITINNVLPISIEFFKGSKGYAGNVNVLDWKVSCTSESYIAISLERSPDGRTFQELNTQIATSTRCTQGFNYVDANSLSGHSYYRLKTTTATGEIGYSNIVVLLNKQKGFELISVRPNPVKDMAILEIISAKTGKIEILITDLAGKIVSKQVVTTIAGINNLRLELLKLSAGTYNIIATNSEGEKRTSSFAKY